MPFASIKITSEPKASSAQKAELIRRVTESIVEVLDKDPQTTFVIIEEVETEAWGIAGIPATVWRAQQAAR
jgi:4-oxalocrotonate tautomerase